MKSIMPFTQDNQEILIHAFISFGETWYESDFRDPSFKVISLTLKELTVIHLVNVMMGEGYTHLFVKGVYIT